MIARNCICCMNSDRSMLYVKLLVVAFEVGLISQAVSFDFQDRKNTSTCVLQDDLAETMDCPAWFRPSENSKCECGADVASHGIHLHCEELHTTIFTTSCITYDALNRMVIAGNCPFNFLNPDKNATNGLQSKLPNIVSQINETMCGPLNRTGLLCSKCKQGLGPAVLSYKMECTKCIDSGYGWLVYVIAAFLPTTVFCIVIVIFQIDVTSASMNMFILMSQLIINNAVVVPSVGLQFMRLNMLPLAVLSFYGIWNLDFFRAVLPAFCISSSMNTLQVLLLDYVVALYPLLLTAVFYYCIEYHDRGCRVLVLIWKPFRRCFWCFRKTWNLKGSVVNAFTTFVILSYCKILYVSTNLLHATKIYNGCGDMLSHVLYFDSSVSYFNGKHLPYALVAIIIPVVFVFFPLVFVLLYQCTLFHRCLAFCRLQSILVSELANVCQRSFKDGSEGGSDCRWFAGVYLLYRIVNSLQFFSEQGYIIVIFLSGTTALICALIQPYKSKFFTVFDSVLFSINSFIFSYIYLAIDDSESPLSLYPVVAACLIPLVYFIMLLTYKLIVITKSSSCTKTVMLKVKSLLPLQTSNHEQDVLPYRFHHPDEYKPLFSVPIESLASSSSTLTREETIQTNEHVDGNNMHYGTV